MKFSLKHTKTLGAFSRFAECGRDVDSADAVSSARRRHARSFRHWSPCTSGQWPAAAQFYMSRQVRQLFCALHRRSVPDGAQPRPSAVHVGRGTRRRRRGSGSQSQLCRSLQTGAQRTTNEARSHSHSCSCGIFYALRTGDLFSRVDVVFLGPFCFSFLLHLFHKNIFVPYAIVAICRGWAMFLFHTFV